MRNGGSALLFMCFCLLGLAAMRAQAANGAWISTGDGASGYWTNHANWSASPYPGNGNTAALTNAAAGAYTAILDNSIATLTTLNLSNTAGQAWLVVTQGAAEAALVVTTINMDQGGRIRIESGGSVTNTSSTGINPLGDATIQINNQGRLVNSAVTFKTNVVLQSGGTIDITSTNSLPMAVNGTLTLALTVVNLPADLGTRDSLTLFLSSDSDISGTVSGWACVPATHTARVVGRAVVIQPWGGGTAIYFR